MSTSKKYTQKEIEELITQTRLETIESVLPENPNQNKLDSIKINNDEEINGWIIKGYRKCRSQIIQTAREKWNINL